MLKQVPMRVLVVTTLIASDTPGSLYSYTIHTQKENGWSVYYDGLVGTGYQILGLLDLRSQCHRTVCSAPLSYTQVFS